VKSEPAKAVGKAVGKDGPRAGNRCNEPPWSVTSFTSVLSFACNMIHSSFPFHFGFYTFARRCSYLSPHPACSSTSHFEMVSVCPLPTPTIFPPSATETNKFSCRVAGEMKSQPEKSPSETASDPLQRKPTSFRDSVAGQVASQPDESPSETTSETVQSYESPSEMTSETIQSSGSSSGSSSESPSETTSETTPETVQASESPPSSASSHSPSAMVESLRGTTLT
jgi:hypothetical protein